MAEYFIKGTVSLEVPCKRKKKAKISVFLKPASGFMTKEVSGKKMALAFPANSDPKDCLLLSFDSLDGRAVRLSFGKKIFSNLDLSLKAIIQAAGTQKLVKIYFDSDNNDNKITKLEFPVEG